MIERVTILMKLLDEAVDVRRRVEAEHVGGGEYRVLGQIPEDEVWEFQPDDVVRCRTRDFVTEKGA